MPNPIYTPPWQVQSNYLQQQNQQPSAGGTQYPANPSPQTYNPTYGGIPGPITVPNPYQDLSAVLPGLSGLNSQVSNNLQAELGGQLSPGTINMLQDQNAAWGAAMGVPGSGLASNRLARNLGLTSEQLSQQGMSDYAKLIASISGTQTVNPALQAEIAARNANINAAPNPADAQSYAQNLFNRYLQGLRGPGGGSTGLFNPGGGTGTNPVSGLGFGPGTLGPLAGGSATGSPYDGGYYQGLSPDQSNAIDAFWNAPGATTGVSGVPYDPTMDNIDLGFSDLGSSDLPFDLNDLSQG